MTWSWLSDLTVHRRDPRAVLAHHRKAIFQTPPVLISEIEAQLRVVGPYRTITIYEASQLRCLVVMLLRKELGKGCLGRICQISRKVKQGTLPLSLGYDLQIKKKNSNPDISLVMQFQGELGHDSLSI